MKKFGLGNALAMLALFVMLVFAVIWASMAWTAGSAVPMSGHGWAALIIGVVFSLLIGCGLMALMFYSSHSGHDIVATPNVFRERSDDTTSSQNGIADLVKPDTAPERKDTH